MQNPGFSGSYVCGNRLLSQSVWGDCPIENLRRGDMDGFFFLEDWALVPTFSDAIAAPLTGWFANYDAGTVGPIAPGTKEGTILRLATAATDADESVLASGGNLAAGALTQIEETASGIIGPTFLCPNVWLEFGLDLVAASMDTMQAFVGLADVLLTAGDALLTNAAPGTLIDNDLIGFHIADSAGAVSVWNAVYRKAGAALQVVAAGILTPTTGLRSKLALHYNSASKELMWYLNGVVVATLKTPSAPVISGIASPAAFPNGVPMAIYAAVKAHEAEIKNMDLDFIACAAQEASS